MRCCVCYEKIGDEVVKGNVIAKKESYKTFYDYERKKELCYHIYCDRTKFRSKELQEVINAQKESC